MTAYITSGGFLAVAWSDVFQGALMFVGLVLLPAVALMDIGGWSALLNQLQNSRPKSDLLDTWRGLERPFHRQHRLTHPDWPRLLGLPQIFVRFIALKDEKESQWAPQWLLSGPYWQTAVQCSLGCGRAIFADPSLGMDLTADAEAVLPALVEYSFSPFIVGLYIAIVLSAIMSTVDSLLILASSAAVRDYHQQIKNPHLSDDALIGISRKVTLGLAGAGLAIALLVSVLTETRSVFWFVIFGWSGISATFCPVMILSLFWSRLTANGAVTAMIVGFVGVPVFKFIVPTLPAVGPFFGALGELPPAFASHLQRRKYW